MSNEADDADREYEPHFKAALANSRNSRFGPISKCTRCEEDNDRPQYAVCSCCLEEIAEAKKSGRLH